MAPHSGGMEGSAMKIGAVLELSGKGGSEEVTPVLEYNPNGQSSHTPATSRLAGGSVTLESLQAGMGGGISTVTIRIHRHGEQESGGEALIVEASIKPFINLLWAGTVLILGGFFLAILKRVREQ